MSSSRGANSLEKKRVIALTRLQQCYSKGLVAGIEAITYELIDTGNVNVFGAAAEVEKKMELRNRVSNCLVGERGEKYAEVRARVGYSCSEVVDIAEKFVSDKISKFSYKAGPR